MQSIALVVADSQFDDKAAGFCRQYGFTLATCGADHGFEFVLGHEGLQLFNRDEKKQLPIWVDFVSGANAHRRLYGGGKGQLIAKAVGVKSGQRPTVLDATGGLGKDAFVLAGLGCQVTLIERHPVVRALLQDGLERGYADPVIGQWLRANMILSDHRHIADYLAANSDPAQLKPDVVYLDPMYPHRQKSALVKKDMRTFQTIVGSDLDADQLLAPALALATQRVIVKRPDYAEDLASQRPTLTMASKNNRFDIYVVKNIKSINNTPSAK